MVFVDRETREVIHTIDDGHGNAYRAGNTTWTVERVIPGGEAPHSGPGFMGIIPVSEPGGDDFQELKEGFPS